MDTKLVVLLSIFLVVGATSCKGQRAYKKQTRTHITDLAVGNDERAISDLRAFLKAHPGDTEALYGLALGLALQGKPEQGLEFVHKALELGLPLERFLAGPREINKALVETPGFQALAKAHAETRLVEVGAEGLELNDFPLNGLLLHGPLLGSITDSGARVWVRTREETTVEVALGTDRDSLGLVKASGRTDASRDFTTVVTVSGLEPDTVYFYRLKVAGQTLSPIYRLRTFPRTGGPAKFQLVFGGGAGFNPQHERMWDVLHSQEALAFFSLGDNVYIDTPLVRSTQQYCYYRRQSRPEWRRLTASTPVYAIWDDHDFYTNDGRKMEGRPDDWKLPVWKTFRNNWNNPTYGFGEEHPGCFFKTSIANVDFFFLDGRYYRDREVGTHLGARQKRWLFDGLKESKALFKVLCSNVPITPNVKPGSNDTWDGFPAEREELLTFLETEKVEGVLFLAADRHRSDAWRTERENGYPIYEFQSSRLTNVHKHKVLPGSIFGYNEKCSFGRLTFDTTATDPEITYEVINIDNETVHHLTLKASQLKHP